MTPESQVIAIAEACGKNVEMYENSIERFLQFCYNSKIPDYLNDLNAMHEAIMSLTLEDQCNMLEILRKDVLKFTAPTITATAEQCLEAFLKTLNLWTP